MKVLIDNGHGMNTRGKCSPDGKHREWAWTREVAQMLVEELTRRGIDAQRIVTEAEDVSLRERCRRVNAIYKANGNKDVILVSIHNNAAGADGRWHEASGFSVYVSFNASVKSKQLAQELCARALDDGLKGNRAVPLVGYWVGNLAMCRDTNCPAVLTENMFQDNEHDLDFITSAEGKRRIVKVHADAIENFIKQQNKL